MQGPEEEEEICIQYFRDSEGNMLDNADIQKNVAKCGPAKVCLNSIWGKLTESNNRPKYRIITERQELPIPRHTSIDVTTMLFAGDEMVCVTWKYAEEEETSLSCVTRKTCSKPL